MFLSGRGPMTSRIWISAVALAVSLGVAIDVQAQGRGGRAGGGPPATGRAAAAQDLTGTWVSVVTEHWHLRMLVPPKGDFSMLPLNPEARKIAMSWDPAKDQAEGRACNAYGAATIMRVPSRYNVQWVDDNTLGMDVDSGMQRRVLHFNTTVPATQQPDLQGYSVASWDGGTGRGRGGAGSGAHLKVVTTKMKAGYLRKNGIPYSDQATLEEHYDRFTEPNGDNWMVVTLIVTDPVYLTGPYATTNHFKKIPDKQGWDPTPCRADQAR
jgi:hypothetical protein